MSQHLHNCSVTYAQRKKVIRYVRYGNIWRSPFPIKKKKKIGNFSITLIQSCRKGVVCKFAGTLCVSGFGSWRKKVAFKHVNVHGKIKKCLEFNHIETAMCYVSEVTMLHMY